MVGDIQLFTWATILSFATGLLHAFRADVPAYVKWGIDPNSVCGYTAINVTDTHAADDIQDPIATASSLLYAVVGFLVARHTSMAGELYMFLSVLSAGSALMHASEYVGSRELDHYMSVAAPLAVLFTFKPLWTPVITVIALVLLYTKLCTELAVAITSGVLGWFVIGYFMVKKHYRIHLKLMPVVASAVASALVTKNYGRKLETICTNDVHGAFVADAAHSAWHISTAMIVWLGAVWILTGDTTVIMPNHSYIPLSLALITPAGFTFTDDYQYWIVCVSIQSILYMGWWYLSTTPTVPTTYNKLSNPDVYL